jgi:hypothetical protein
MVEIVHAATCGCTLLPMTVHSIIAMSEALQLYLFACTLARTC